MSIYSNRFIINTMQLVGATRRFIRKPFVNRSILHGLIGGLLANIILVFLIFSYNKQFHEVINYNINNLIIIVCGIVFFSGITITWISTTRAVNKFLRMRYDELFY